MLKDILKDNHLSLYKVADASGIHATQIYRYLEGERDLRLKTAYKIKKGLNKLTGKEMTIDEIFNYKKV